MHEQLAWDQIYSHVEPAGFSMEKTLHVQQAQKLSVSVGLYNRDQTASASIGMMCASVPLLHDKMATYTLLTKLI